jgi:3-deoxy-D-manno-octulosonic-acid transferase
MNGEREKRGDVLYKIYRAFTYGLTPLIHLHLRWRKLRGLEHSLRWPERLGRPSLPRPAGSLVWFHAVSLGEGMAAIPVVRCCIKRRPDVTVLMTTTTTSAFDVIKNLLPSNVIYQYAPIDTASAMDSFFSYWKPNAIMLLESELWPNLIMIASRNGVQLVLLNARMSAKSYRNWSIVLQLSSLMLSKFSLILPLSNKQAIHFQLLQASPSIIKFSGDLKYVIEECNNSKTSMDDLRAQLQNRFIWMASSIHNGEEQVMIGVHKVLKQTYPDLLTIIVPRRPQLGQDIARELKKEGLSVALR